MPARRSFGFGLPVLAVLVALPLLAACSPAPADEGRGTQRRARSALMPTSDRVVYVAIGASDTVGIGSADPARDAWPAVFARAALPPGTKYVNLGIPGATTAEAIQLELPRALTLDPTIATVWLNVNDLTHGVSPQAYEQELRELLSALRRGGRTEVLVATTPRLDSLPAYLACRRSPASCSIGPFVPPPVVVRTAVDAYNDAIRTVAQETGSIVVDLDASGDVPVEHPGWVSSDGFHPSTTGYRHVAQAFANALDAA